MTNGQSENDFILPAEGGCVGFLGISSQRREGARENTGNFLHGFAARYITGQYQNILPEKLTDEMVEKYRSELTHVALVTANAIRDGSDNIFDSSHKRIADAIQRLNLPVVVFGLGAQAKLDQPPSEMKISTETMRFLSVLSNYSPQIAVRGEFTADLCRRFGIHNIEVVGCQSCFISRRPDFKLPEMKETINPNRLVINVTNHTRELPIIAAAMSEGAHYIGQTEHFEYELAKLKEDLKIDNLPAEVRSLLKPGLLKLFDSERIKFNEFHHWIRNNFHQFYSMPPWFKKLEGNFDASIGTRFHGNMAAMQAGVPSLWIVHDSRTKEFCDYLGLPQAPLTEVNQGIPIAELFDRHYDTSDFSKKYPGNYARLYDYLTKHGVPHKLAAPIRS